MSVIRGKVHACRKPVRVVMGLVRSDRDSTPTRTLSIDAKSMRLHNGYADFKN